MSLNGRKHALITGSSRGIGRGIALKLAEQGTKVAINYRSNEAAANEALNKIREIGSDGFIIQADVSRPEDISRMFNKVEEEFGSLDIFVSNARPELPEFYQSPMELTLESWSSALDSQGTAFLVGIREAINLMGEGGRVVAVTYAPGSRTGSWQSWVAMGSAKAALESLVRYFAVSLAQRGITVNTVSPGLTEDSVFSTLPQEVQKLARDWHESGFTPMGRMGTPADIGNAVSLLCSEDASWITGQILYADGGASLVDPVLPLEIQRG